MRKVEVAERIAAATDLPKHTAEQTIDTILATIKTSLQQGEAVTRRGLGTLAVRAKRARPGCNPKTGAAATIPPRRVVVFKAGEVLRQAVAGVPTPAAVAAPPRATAARSAATSSDWLPYSQHQRTSICGERVKAI